MYGASATRPAIFSYTPEVGSPDDGFWPAPDRIVPIAQENVRANRLALLVAGPYLAVDHVEVRTDPDGNGSLDPGEIATVEVCATNIGRSALVGGGTAALLSSNPDATDATDAGQRVATVPASTAPDETACLGPFSVRLNAATPLGDLTGLSVVLTLSPGTLPQTLALPPITVGSPQRLFLDTAETLASWTPAGAPAATDWGLSPTVFTSAPTSFADSPGGPYPANTDRTLTLTTPIVLTGTERLSFQIKVDTEPTYDVATVEAQVGAGAWTPLAVRFTAPSTSAAPSVPLETPVYTGTHPFRTETVSLAAVAGPSVRFRLRSAGYEERDGVAVDDVVIERLVSGSGTVAGEPGAPGTAAGLRLPSPNPARGRFRIPVTLPESGGEVTVVDALGRRVAVLDVVGGVAEWDAARVAPGVTVVRLHSAQGGASRRVVVR